MTVHVHMCGLEWGGGKFAHAQVHVFSDSTLFHKQLSRNFKKCSVWFLKNSFLKSIFDKND